jgi:hypothetical protein
MTFPSDQVCTREFLAVELVEIRVHKPDRADKSIYIK